MLRNSAWVSTSAPALSTTLVVTSAKAKADAATIAGIRSAGVAWGEGAAGGMAGPPF